MEDHADPPRSSSIPIASMSMSATRPIRSRVRAAVRNSRINNNSDRHITQHRINTSRQPCLPSNIITTPIHSTKATASKKPASTVENSASASLSLLRGVLSAFGGTAGSIVLGLGSMLLAYRALPATAKIISDSMARALPGFVPSRIPADRNRGSPAAGGRSAAIVWFRKDLRLHDNEALMRANAEATSILPVYCFDPREYGRDNKKHYRSGPHRTRFLMESVKNLKQRLQDLGSDLVVRIGRPENVLVDLVRRTGAGSVYCHSEVSHHEQQVESKVQAAMSREGVELKTVWGNNLFSLDDLSFSTKSVLDSYGSFARKLASTAVPKPIEVPGSLKALPLGDIDVGRLPTMRQLGFRGMALKPTGDMPMANLKGGEEEGVRRLTACLKEVSTQQVNNKHKTTEFSTMLSSFLAVGCLSPRFMYHELGKYVKGPLQLFAQDKNKSSGKAHNTGVWLTTTLMWREYFRLTAKWYLDPAPATEAAPSTAQVTAAAPLVHALA